MYDTRPDLGPAPTPLDFTGGTGIGTDFTALSPDLKQILFIGDGLTGDGIGTVQRFNIPAGAQRFFLGTVDGTQWVNNSGTFAVSTTRAGSAVVVPEATTFALSLPALGILGAVVMRRRKSA